MLVDPSFESFEWQDPLTLAGSVTASTPSPNQQIRRACTMLQDVGSYTKRDALWNARSWKAPNSVALARDDSAPYHAGPCTLAPGLTMFTNDATAYACLQHRTQQDLKSPLDEMIFHWTKLATPEQVSAACESSVNSAYYLLKYVATHWINQLELIGCTVSLSEYLADDHQARVDVDESTRKWKSELTYLSNATLDINHVRRQLSYFEQACMLNIERLGGSTSSQIHTNMLPSAISDAQTDFLAILCRLRTYSDRLSGLRSLANDLTNLHTAFRSVNASDFGLRISLFAGIVFPMTLVSGVLSMEGRYLPGHSSFWVFWAVSIPLVLVLTLALFLGRRPFDWLFGQSNVA